MMILIPQMKRLGAVNSAQQALTVLLYIFLKITTLKHICVFLKFPPKTSLINICTECNNKKLKLSLLHHFWNLGWGNQHLGAEHRSDPSLEIAGLPGQGPLPPLPGQALQGWGGPFPFVPGQGRRGPQLTPPDSPQAPSSPGVGLGCQAWTVDSLFR